jgi:hypothetical protein
VQLRQFPRTLHHMRRPGHLRRLLLQRVRADGEGQGRVPQDRQFGLGKDGSVV